MDSTTLIVILLVGVIIASVVGLLASGRSSGSIKKLEHSLNETKKQSRQNAELAGKNAGIAERLQSEEWCRKNRPAKLDLKEFQ